MKSFLQLFFAWHRLFRTEHALITFIGVLAGELLVTRNFSPALLFPAIGPALIVLAAFALNDYFGFETDKANHRKDRPLVSGEIQKSHALYAAALLFLVGLGLTYLVNLTVFLIALAYVFLSLVYDNYLKKLPLAGNVFIALSMAGPFIYGNLAVSPAVLETQVILICLIAFFVGLGRELLITLRDVKGDKKIGATTLPMLAGPKPTVVLAAFFILLALLLSLVPLSTAPLLYLAFLIPCDALLLFTVYKALKSQDNLTLKQCRNYTLAALALGVIAFLALSL